MSDRQRIIVWIGVGLVFATGLFPPWTSDSHSRYAWLFTPPSAMRLDFPRLAVGWILILVFISAMLFAPLKLERLTSFAGKAIILVLFVSLIALLVTFSLWWVNQTYSVPPPPQYQDR